jgi:hypothetical protein
MRGMIWELDDGFLHGRHGETDGREYDDEAASDEKENPQMMCLWLGFFHQTFQRQTPCRIETLRNNATGTGLAFHNE